MKKIMVALLMAALIGGGVFAGEGFDVTAQVEGNIFTQTAGDTGITDTGFFTGLGSPHGDYAVKFNYTDPDGLYGATWNIKNAAMLDAVNAWVKFGGIIKVSAGKGIGYRAIEKVGGDADFGVQKLVDKGSTKFDLTKNTDAEPALSSTDPFKFGDGLLLNVLAGPLDVGLFAGPSQGFRSWNQDTDAVAPYAQEDEHYWTGDPIFEEGVDLFNFQYGLSVLFKQEIVDAGAVFKWTRTGVKSFGAPDGASWDNVDFSLETPIGYTPDGTPIYDPTALTSGNGSFSAPTGAPTIGSWGYDAYDFGLYAKIKPISGLVIGVGYTGHQGWVRASEGSTAGVDDEGTYNNPYISGVGLDVNFTGVPKLTVGVYNNASFWHLDEKEGPPQNSPNAADVIRQDEQDSFFMFNRLEVAYKVTDKLTADFLASNYWQKLTNNTDRTPYNNVDNTTELSIDKLVLRAGVEYSVVPDKAKAWARVQFTDTFYSGTASLAKVKGNANAANGTTADDNATSRNHYTIAIPVGIQVKF